MGIATPGLQRTTNPITLIFFGVVFFLLGGCLLYFWGVPTTLNVFLSQHWPSTEGVITVSNFAQHYGGGSHGSTTYSADIGYDYAVQNIKQSGTQVAFGDYSSSSASHAREIVNKYPVGTAVNVFYDPKNVSDAILEPGVTLSSFFPFAFSLFFFLIGIFLIFQGWKRRSQNQAPQPQSSVIS